MPLREQRSVLYTFLAILKSLSTAADVCEMAKYLIAVLAKEERHTEFDFHHSSALIEISSHGSDK